MSTGCLLDVRVQGEINIIFSIKRTEKRVLILSWYTSNILKRQLFKEKLSSSICGGGKKLRHQNKRKQIHLF